MNLSARDIQAFLALAEVKNFTRAAVRCHLSQPAFSALIKALEASVGLQLFDRSTRHVLLTPEGERFLLSAQRIAAELEDCAKAMRDTAQLARGHVSVALLPSLAAGWLPQVLAQFMARHPGVDLAVHDFHLVCREEHALAEQQTLGVADLQPWPFVHLARHSSVRQYLDAAFFPQSMHTLVEVEQLATVMGLVQAGLGISVVPALSLFHFDKPGLVTRPLPLPGMERQIYLVRRRERSLSLAAQALYRLMLEQRPPFSGP